MRGSGDSMVLRETDAPAPEVRAPDPEVVANLCRRAKSMGFVLQEAVAEGVS